MKINEKKAPIHFTQTSLASHEAWAALTMKSQRASQLMHLFVANVGDENAVVASQKNLARLMGVKSVNTVKAAIKILIDGNWIQVVRLGERGGVNAYVLNSSVAWSEKRENIRYAKFTAEVIVSSDEQVQPITVQREELYKLPFINERQLPTGEGLPPPAEPALPGLEPDLPAKHNSKQIDLEDLIESKTT